MKIYGSVASSPDELVELHEITLHVSPNDLNKFSDFLNRCKERISDDGWEHEHLRDMYKSEEYAGPDIIIFKKDSD